MQPTTCAGLSCARREQCLHHAQAAERASRSMGFKVRNPTHMHMALCQTDRREEFVAVIGGEGHAASVAVHERFSHPKVDESTIAAHP